MGERKGEGEKLSDVAAGFSLRIETLALKVAATVPYILNQCRSGGIGRHARFRV